MWQRDMFFHKFMMLDGGGDGGGGDADVGDADTSADEGGWDIGVDPTGGLSVGVGGLEGSEADTIGGWSTPDFGITGPDLGNVPEGMPGTDILPAQEPWGGDNVVPEEVKKLKPVKEKKNKKEEKKPDKPEERQKVKRKGRRSVLGADEEMPPWGKRKKLTLGE